MAAPNCAALSKTLRHHHDRGSPLEEAFGQGGGSGLPEPGAVTSHQCVLFPGCLIQFPVCVNINTVV